MKYPLTAVKIY